MEVERETKARKAWWGAWKMGVEGQWVTVKNAVMIWKVMVQSVLDYATEVFGGMERWEEAERVARKMGRAILGVRSSTANEVVMGELGWWTMKARRDFLRLLYWREIVARKKGLRWEVYQEGRRRIGRDKEAWCDYTRKIMKELGLGEYWEKQDVEKIHKGEWRVIVGKKMQEKEQEEWKRRVESKSKLRTYRKVKTELETEEYLEEGTAQERRVMVMMRGGTNDLRIETGRYEKLEKDERKCIFCESGEVEDETHFLCRCEAWREERELVLEKVRKLEVRMSEEQIMLLGGREEMRGRGQATVKSWRKIVLRGVMMMNRKRKREWRRRCMGVGDDGSSSIASDSDDSGIGSASIGISAGLLARAAELLGSG